MRFISSKIHGVIDYAFAAILVLSPWLFGFADNVTALWVAIVAGVGVMIYSLITRYEPGHWMLIPVTVHLWFDAILGVALMVSPWFFGFREEVVTPFVVFGLLALVIPMLTKTHSTVEDRMIAEGEYATAYGRHQGHLH